MGYDAIIIGAGLSGLTSALLLARNDRKVLVVEKQSRPQEFEQILTDL